MDVEDTPYKHRVMLLVHSHESYSIGTKKEVPDIVIEIIVTSGTINRKELYKPKQVPEIWFWKSDTIRIFRLNSSGEYEEVERSSFFPNLDPNVLLQYIAMPDQYDAILEFEQFLREQRLLRLLNGSIPCLVRFLVVDNSSTICLLSSTLSTS